MDKGFRSDARPAIKHIETALIPLGINAKDGYAIVDIEDAVIDRTRWSLQKRGYAIGYIDGENILMHHLIFGKPPKGKVVDHINRNKLDNRRCNLRFVPQRINAINSTIQKNNTSGYKGVTFEKRRNKWLAQCVYKGKNHFGGYYDNIQDAIEARKTLEKKLNFKGRT